MNTTKKDLFVYAHWFGMPQPMLIGILSAHMAKGRKSFSFEYEKAWLESNEHFLLDPDITWFSGQQFPVKKENFGVFMDSMPDTWGRILMKRRELQHAKHENRMPHNLYDIDFLLGVNDESRMGALRFKTDKDGPFLDFNPDNPIPIWSSINEIQQSVELFESEQDSSNIASWLNLLVAPGSSLGGARPKANILDGYKHPWIAKFPSRNDIIDKAAWEYLAYLLALDCKIEMADSRIQKVRGRYNTFFTKRFDRYKLERVHFASAMTMTGNNEETVKENTPSYLELAEFIQFNGANSEYDLQQLWRRIYFSIAISNTDDHLRNHGFLLKRNGWHLSPAYDINPSIDKEGLSLNIDLDNNALDFELARNVGKYFRLNRSQMDSIELEVKKAISGWKFIARKIGIPNSEIEQMAAAFRY